MTILTLINIGAYILQKALAQDIDVLGVHAFNFR
jgi:hypothetical protein